MYGSCGSQAPPRFHVRIHPIVYAQREVRRDYRLVRTNEIHERVVIRTSAFLGTRLSRITYLLPRGINVDLIRRVSRYVLIRGWELFLDIVTYQRGKVRKKEGNEEKSKSFDLFTLHSNSSFAVIYISAKGNNISNIYIHDGRYKYRIRRGGGRREKWRVD